MTVSAIVLSALAFWQAGSDQTQRLARGYQLLEQGKLADAQRELSEIVRADPKSIDGRILLGMTNYHLEQNHEAMEQLTEALRLEPDSVQAHYVLGMVYLRKQDLDDAEQHLIRAYSGETGRADILQPLSQVLLMRGKAPELVRWLEQGRSAGIQNAGLLFTLGWAYSAIGNFGKAEEITLTGLRLSGTNQQGWLTLIKAQLQQGHDGRLRALESLERAPGLAGTWQKAYLTGLANYMLDRHDAAVVPLRRATELAPDGGAIQLLLAICLTSVGDTGEAEQRYRRAIALDERNALFHYYYGLMLRHEQKPAQSAAEFGLALKHDPKLAEAYLNLGLILDESGKEQESIESLEKAIALAPELARGYYSLGRIYLRKKQTDRGAAMMRRFQELKANEAEQSRRRLLESAMSSVVER